MTTQPTRTQPTPGPGRNPITIQEFDEKYDSQWADRDLIGPAILVIGGLLALVGLFLWGGW